AAPTIGLQIQILKASTSREIDAAFATIEREHPDALFVSADAFFVSRAVQFATLTARSRIPATYPGRDFVAVGGLRGYGTDLEDSYRQVGAYPGRILKGAKPADLPVTQSTKFELVINLQTARRMHGRRALFAPADVQPAGVDLDLVPLQIAKLGSSKPVAVGQQDHGGVPVAIAAVLARGPMSFSTSRPVR